MKILVVIKIKLISSDANLCDYDENAKKALLALANNEEITEDDFSLWMDFMICCGYSEKYCEDYNSIVYKYIFAKKSNN